MSDPSVEAAQRAWADEGWEPRHFGLCSESSLGIAAAREMAKSVQELHQPGPVSGFSTSWMTGAEEECTTCRRHWPCGTAKRVYPSEDL